jgi:hypothetical protein
MTKHEQIIAALDAFVAQRSGIEYANYGGDIQAFRSERRSITRDLQDYRILRSAIALRTFADAQWEDAFRAYSGRLSYTNRPDGSIALDYTTGQYFPTEYRKAACAVLASVLWHAKSANMPAPQGKIMRKHGPFESTHDNIEGMTPGDWIRKQFKREFGRGIQSRWFN